MRPYSREVITSFVERNNSVSQCKYYTICGRDVEGNPVDGVCILHSADPPKRYARFHRCTRSSSREKGERLLLFCLPRNGRLPPFANGTFTGDVNFTAVIFGGRADFTEVTFAGEALFFKATFAGEALFSYATFGGRADFTGATFAGEANFADATFTGEAEADFGGAKFIGEANFTVTTFGGRADFTEVTFAGEAYFYWARFTGEASFAGAAFTKVAAFHRATFSGRTLFAAKRGLGLQTYTSPTLSESSPPLFAARRGAGFQAAPIFSGAEVDFRQVVIVSPDAMTFLEADLMQCRFQATDLRKVQLVGVQWPKKGQRVVVYDEIAPVEAADGEARPWSQIERLYSELKQNYEDRRDYERAGDFHYGEKDIRRRNPETPWGLYFFLTLYWLFSGYGERYLRPLMWAGMLFIASTTGYLWWGLRPKEGGSTLVLVSVWDWLRAAYYSFRVMTFLKPDDLLPLGYAKVVNTFQTLLSPVLLGLFGLALRQRLKR